jgi:hypothetical protein
MSGQLHALSASAIGNQWIGVWVDPRAGLDNVEKIKFLALPRLELRSLKILTVSKSISQTSHRFTLLDKTSLQSIEIIIHLPSFFFCVVEWPLCFEDDFQENILR